MSSEAASPPEPAAAGGPRSRRTLGLALAAAGVLLVVSAVPGVFTIDEDNYLMTLVSLRRGRLTVPGTAGLTPSSELIWFEPTGRSRRVTRTPVVSTAPPLYAPLAWPLSYLGWRGLVALNVAALLGVVALVFRLARTPWVAAAACGLGGYLVGYAQGVWPQILSAFLCTLAFALAARARAGATAAALPSGVAAGVAMGVRYPNVLYASGVGLGLLALAPSRAASAALFAAGAALPLAASAAINPAGPAPITSTSQCKNPLS